jgi:hypothetical protein
MDEHARRVGRLHEGRPRALGALIHDAVRRVIEVAVEEELTAALGAVRYAGDVGRGGYRNGHRPPARPDWPDRAEGPHPAARHAVHAERRPGMDVGARAPLSASVARGE